MRSPSSASSRRFLMTVSSRSMKLSTKLKYEPGIVNGEKHLVHDCGVSGSIGYFLEPLIVLGLFGKKPLSIRLKAEPAEGIVLTYALKSELEALKLKDLKHIWDSMKKKYRGTTKVKRQQLQAFHSEFEMLRMKLGELTTDYFARTMAIVNKMRIYDVIEKEEEVSLLMVCHVKEETHKNLWYLDTGCSNHMCGEKSSFSKLDKAFHDVVKFGDNSKVSVMGKGKGYGISIKNGVCRIVDEKLGLVAQVNMTANRMFPLYLNNTTHSCFSAKLRDAAWLWHFRYGHLNFGGLKTLQQKDMVIGLPQITAPSEVCEECVKVLELVHSDICGPITPCSDGGKRYIITFIDDYSRKIWVYLLQEKSEAFAAFKSFKALVEKEVGQLIKVLRKDRGGEYNSHEFANFLKYVGEILDRFQMKDCNPVTTPSESGLKLNKDNGGTKVDNTLYKQIVGSLMYLTATRPNIMHAASVISRYMECPTEIHLLATKRIFRYCRGTKEFGLFYKKGEKSDLYGFTDNDYAGDSDDQKSTSGYVFMMGTRAVSWSSRKQSIVTLSTTEAEFVAAAAWITNDSKDPSVDTFRSTTLPILKHFGVPSEGLDLKIECRGALPHGGGEVFLSVPTVGSSLTVTVAWTDEGMVKRLGELLFQQECLLSLRIPLYMQLEEFLIACFRMSTYLLIIKLELKLESMSPGYGISLVAETTIGCFISADTAVSYARGDEEGEIEDEEKKELMPPVDVGEQIAPILLGKIERGVVDSTHQGLLFILCALCPQDVSKVRVGKLSPYGIETPRNIRDFLGVKFVIKPDPSTGTVILKCVGCGLTNLSRKAS
ncbi:unnamed protein product [Camellia sinensis]